MDDQNQKSGIAVERAGGPHAHYCRLFGKRSSIHTRDDLAALADNMKAALGTATDLTSTNSMLVYFGQFIDHDITRDRTKLDTIPYPEPEKTLNMRSPRLDLDSVYADGPDGRKCQSPEEDGCAVYDSSRPGAEQFELTRVGNGFDIPRDAGNNPWIGDPRNDENLIISQLHVLFMRFHNRVVELLQDSSLSFPAPGAGSIFDRARRFVVWHYQWLVRELFLRSVVRADVFSEVTTPGYKPRLFDVDYDTVVDLPVEFTMAAFRFGHSMVRDTYQLNEHQSIPLSDVLNKEPAPLKPENVIDWSVFLSNQAQAIDRTIAFGLYELGDRIVSLYLGAPATQGLSLPARTLIRSEVGGLASGQEACKRARVPVLAFSPTDRDFHKLRDFGMLYDTPLWYYLLYEAEMTGTDSAGIGALTLGPLGSRIVAEIILALLKADKASYIHHYWEPPAFSTTPGAPKQIINSFEHLIAFTTGTS